MRHIVMFDIDGTLVDSNGFDGDLFARAVREELGVHVDTTWQSYRHVTDSGVLEELLSACSSDTDTVNVRNRVKSKFIRYVGDYLAETPSALAPVPGAPEFLRTLDAMPEVLVAIATGGWRETAELKLRSAGFDYATLPFGSSSDADARVDIMRAAEQQAAVHGALSRRTYFGDAPWDLEASAELGYDFICIGDRLDHAPRFPDFRDREGILAALGAR